MDLVTVISIVAITVLIIILLMTLNQGSTKVAKTAPEKKREILDTYKTQLRNELLPLQDNPEVLKQKKSALLKEISNELARNIFFDHDEMRAAIQELANYNYEEN